MNHCQKPESHSSLLLAFVLTLHAPATGRILHAGRHPLSRHNCIKAALSALHKQEAEALVHFNLGQERSWTMECDVFKLKYQNNYESKFMMEYWIIIKIFPLQLICSHIQDKLPLSSSQMEPLEEKGEHLVFTVSALCLPYSSWNVTVIMPVSCKALSPGETWVLWKPRPVHLHSIQSAQRGSRHSAYKKKSSSDFPPVTPPRVMSSEGNLHALVQYPHILWTRRLRPLNTDGVSAWVSLKKSWPIPKTSDLLAKFLVVTGNLSRMALDSKASKIHCNIPGCVHTLDMSL